MNTLQQKALLRKAGLRITPARLRVLETIGKSRQPLSAQEIIEAFTHEIDQATIYRTIKSLAESKIISPVDLRHNHAHYEITHTEDHHHLVCTVCGKVEELAGCELEETYSKILKHAKMFTQIENHSLEFYGKCKRCAGPKV